VKINRIRVYRQTPGDARSSYAEYLQLRHRCNLAMKLDKCITGLDMAQRAVVDQAAEIICLKISNLGGLSKARVVRDFLVANRVPVVCEDTWGGEITTATLVHFAVSTPAELLVSTTDLHSYNVETTGISAPRTEGDRLFPANTPGLGVEPDYNSLGDPVGVYQ